MRVRGNLADLLHSDIGVPVVSTSATAIGRYFYVSVAAGLLLVFAAVMKWQSPIEAVIFGGIVLTTRWVRVAIVVFEAAFGLWLLSGALARAARITAIICFALFLCITLYETYIGAQSCGCFGDLHVHPIYTAVLDIVILIAFAVSHPKTCHGIQWQSPALLIPILLLMISAGGIAMLLAQNNSSTPDNNTNAAGGLMVLEPQTWVGKPLPILKYIDCRDKLAHGNWIVILYRHDCPACREEIPHFVSLARKTAGQVDAPRLAFIEIPPYGTMGGLIPAGTPCLRGQLSRSHEWFVETPVVMKMNNSVVMSANHGTE